MSYSRSYQRNVQYSGSVRYSYPASQNGGSGTVPYSGSVPVNVTINVNTNPFEGSVNRFNNSVDILSGAVVTMNAAQCAAIQKTGKEVSASIISGFFGMIRSELSQQLQALDSAIKAGFGLIQSQSEAIGEKKDVMEGDYNRISSRYIKLFADLDSECYKRIYALDKQSFSLSEKVQQQLLSESISDTAALNLLSIEEMSSSKTLVFVSSQNRKTLDVLKTLHDYILQESRINSLVNSFLSNEQVDEKIPLAIPVIWSESDTLEGTAANSECFIPAYIGGKEQQRISEIVNGFCSGLSPSTWKPVEQTEKEQLTAEFNVLAESCFSSTDDETEQRVYKTMLSLWQNTELFSPERR